MVNHLAGMFGSAVGMMSNSRARALEIFTEITNYDESACDAGWAGSVAATPTV